MELEDALFGSAMACYVLSWYLMLKARPEEPMSFLTIGLANVVISLLIFSSAMVRPRISWYFVCLSVIFFLLALGWFGRARRLGTALKKPSADS